MSTKPKFKPTGEYVNDNVRSKVWEIVVGGEVVGHIETSIRDLYMSRSNPGYSVTVIGTMVKDQGAKFYKNSNAFSNRSSQEAHENRSEYVRRAKEWAVKYLEKHP